MRNWFWLLASVAVWTAMNSPLWAGVNGSALALKSGTTSGTAAVLANNGYAGTYVTLATAGPVTVMVNASGTVAVPGSTVHMNIVLGDAKAAFDFDPTLASNYSYTFPNVPAGTYFVRNEYINDLNSSARSLKINSFDVTGATISNATDATSLKANALAAADTYVANFRRGPATIALRGAMPGSMAHVKLVRHAFNFGVNVPGSTASDLASYLGTPTPGSKAANFQDFLASHYINTLGPSNYGKWSNTEPAQNSPTMDRIDALLNFAQSHDMRVRMHALVWGDQNPGWILNAPTAGQFGTGLLADAMPTHGGNTGPYTAAISKRIDYYVGAGTSADRANKYIELDVHNEELHKIGPWWALGANGVANVFKEVQDAVSAAGASTKLYVNEYNVLQNSPASIRTPTSSDPGSPYPYNGVQVGVDPYANWFRQNIDDIQTAAMEDPDIGTPVVGGVGSQYYVVAGHSADTMMKALQNLAVTGLPMTLTEFGIQGSVTDQATAATYMEESMRMIFGSSAAETFMYWGFWGGATSSLQAGGTLVGTASASGAPIDSAWKRLDGSWNLTPAGTRYEWLFGLGADATKGAASTNPTPWTTDLLLPVNAAGTITLSKDQLHDTLGFFGDYVITVNGNATAFRLVKGTTDYSLVVPVGDFNGDNSVDAADYTVWRSTVGSTTDLRADGDGNGVVDAGDYDVWRLRFGTDYTAAGGGAAAVPEPAALVWLTMVGAALMALRRRPCEGRRAHREAPYRAARMSCQ